MYDFLTYTHTIFFFTFSSFLAQYCQNLSHFVYHLRLLICFFVQFLSMWPQILLRIYCSYYIILSDNICKMCFRSGRDKFPKTGLRENKKRRPGENEYKVFQWVWAWVATRGAVTQMGWENSGSWNFLTENVLPISATLRSVFLFLSAAKYN